MSIDGTPKKSGGVRTLVIVFAVFGAVTLLGCLACAVGGYFWVDQNAAGLREMGERVQAEASSFAATHSQEECVVDALRRDDACGEQLEIMCHAEAGVFMRACLGQATPTPGLCDGVPGPDEIMAGAQWAVAECARRGRTGDQQCAQLMRGLVEHCAGR